MNKFYFAVAFATLIFAASCTPKNDPELEPTPDVAKDNYYLHGYLKQYRYNNTAFDEGSYFKIEYNADSTVRKIIAYSGKSAETGVVYFELPEYLNRQMVKMEISSPGEGVEFKTEFEYQNGKLIRAVHYNIADVPTLHHIDSLFYDGNGRLSICIFNQPSTRIRDITEITWENENVVDLKTYRNEVSDRALLRHYTYEYLDQPNFLKTMAVYDYERHFNAISNGDITYLSRQLCKKEYSNLSQWTRDTTHRQYTFTENGLLKTMQLTSVSEGGQFGREVMTFLTTYDVRKIEK